MDDDGHQSRMLDILTIPLIDEHKLELRKGTNNDIVRVLNTDNKALCSLIITPGRIILNVASVDVTLETSGKLDIHAEHVRIHGRSGVEITTNGDATIHAAGDMTSEARTQNIQAKVGNVNVRANDDVVLLGERIKLNA